MRGEPSEPEREPDLAVWELDEVHVADVDDKTRVVLACLPPRLWLAARQRHDALMRELVLYLTAHEAEQLVDVHVADKARWLVSHTLAEVLERPRRRTGRPIQPVIPLSSEGWIPETIDLELAVPRDLGPAFRVLQDALDMAERLAVAGALLIRPGLPEIIELRDWVCDQVVAQLAGVPAAPWPGTAQKRYETLVHDTDEEPAWDAGVVRDSATGAVAADDANRIVAVSASLAERLGWAVDDLVGRRLVTLIPRQYREAHVAGFSRHISTGEEHLFGRGLELPVLAQDGTEVRCRFLLERQAVEARAIYIAWLDPLE